MLQQSSTYIVGDSDCSSYSRILCIRSIDGGVRYLGTIGIVVVAEIIILFMAAVEAWLYLVLQCADKRVTLKIE